MRNKKCTLSCNIAPYSLRKSGRFVITKGETVTLQWINLADTTLTNVSILTQGRVSYVEYTYIKSQVKTQEKKVHTLYSHRTHTYTNTHTRLKL